MDKPIITAIEVIVGIVLILIVAAFAFSSTRTQQESGEKAMEQVTDMSNAMFESKFTKYDGAEIRGSEVVSAIRLFETQEEVICVEVNNGKGTELYCYNEELTEVLPSSIDESTAKKKYNDESNSSTYINHSSRYMGSIERDEDTGRIIKVKFDYIKK